MSDYTDKIETFLTFRKIAVTGVSASKPDAANYIFRKLRDSGITVFPVNPKTQEVEGVTCFPNLSALPSLPEGVVIASPPSSCRPIMDECLQLGISYIWCHNTIGHGSYDRESVEYGEKNGLQIIPSGCPMMFYKPVDLVHNCMRWFFNLTGKMPRK